MKDRPEIGNRPLSCPAVVSIAITIILLLSPAPPRWTADVVSALLTDFEASLITEMNPPSIQIGTNQYGIIFWCTPVPLWVCMFLAFGFANLSIARYTILSAVLGSLLALLVPLQVAFAIYLHQKGLRWSFAHYPIYALLHFAGVIAFMSIARKAARNIETTGRPRQSDRD